jgi:hypothetical protein
MLLLLKMVWGDNTDGKLGQISWNQTEINLSFHLPLKLLILKIFFPLLHPGTVLLRWIAMVMCGFGNLNGWSTSISISIPTRYHTLQMSKRYLLDIITHYFLLLRGFGVLVAMEMAS